MGSNEGTGLPQRANTPFDDYVWLTAGASMPRADEAVRQAVGRLQGDETIVLRDYELEADGRTASFTVRAFFMTCSDEVVVFREVLPDDEYPEMRDGESIRTYVAVNRANGRVLGVFEGPSHEAPFAEVAIRKLLNAA